MKRSKKLTRIQRMILEKLGYENIDNIRYLSEKGDVVVFIRDEKEQIEVDKKTYYQMK